MRQTPPGQGAQRSLLRGDRYGQTLAALGPATTQHCLASLGGHAGQKSVNLLATPIARLIGALRHFSYLSKCLPVESRRRAVVETRGSRQVWPILFYVWAGSACRYLSLKRTNAG